jgi:hypothetical protein
MISAFQLPTSADMPAYRFLNKSAALAAACVSNGHLCTLDLSCNSAADKEAEIDLLASEWRLADSIDDTDIIFGGRRLSAFYEGDRRTALHGSQETSDSNSHDTRCCECCKYAIQICIHYRSASLTEGSCGWVGAQQAVLAVSISSALIGNLKLLSPSLQRYEKRICSLQ